MDGGGQAASVEPLEEDEVLDFFSDEVDALLEESEPDDEEPDDEELELDDDFDVVDELRLSVL